MDKQDAIEREDLRGPIVLIRPNTRLTAKHPDLRRRCLLYLLRLAPLTRRNGYNVVERTTTGACFGVPRENFDAFENKFAAKFGFTQETAQTALDEVVAHCQNTGFPDKEELDPVFALAIYGLPCDPYLLQQLENGLREYLGREAVRLGFSGNTKNFEFVCTDAQGDRLFTLYQNFLKRLEVGRKEAQATVARQDIRRRQQIDARRDVLRMEQRKEYARYRQQCRHAEELEKTRLQRAGIEDPKRLAYLHDQHDRLQQCMRSQQRAALKRIETETPRVDVGQILTDALITAALRK
ncbi:hypothetical protein P3T76_012520 [Phytophthora citrophthora]|uniref:Uncharacterized protein n=1 Tax=Phytophthora citrophthora TaxID=4793 RepID=A0AAD9G583_9STRA|nr:hypothetical protein P3T76_012520 [Phytophthora citrophthora]